MRGSYACDCRYGSLASIFAHPISRNRNPKLILQKVGASWLLGVAHAEVMATNNVLLCILLGVQKETLSITKTLFDWSSLDVLKPQDSASRGLACVGLMRGSEKTRELGTQKLQGYVGILGWLRASD